VPGLPPRLRAGQDIDFACVSKGRKDTAAFLERSGCVPDRRFNNLNGDRQMYFTAPSGQSCDAQAAYESLMTLLPTFLAGANWVMHAAGWLEGGLVSCYEKFIVDIELLRMLRVEFTPLEIDEESLAFGAHEEVGHGGHFLGAQHTMERFRECFYRPLLSSTANYERWLKLGGKDATVRAGEICAKTLAEYQQPPLDEAIRAELADYVARRRAELGD
jgi:trimethylamine---corrinoid protein Co-methyltransferase